MLRSSAARRSVRLQSNRSAPVPLPSCFYQPGVTFLGPPNGRHQTPREKRGQPTQIVSSSLVYLFDTWRRRLLAASGVFCPFKGMASTNLALDPMVPTVAEYESRPFHPFQIGLGERLLRPDTRPTWRFLAASDRFSCCASQSDSNHTFAFTPGISCCLLGSISR